MKLEREEPFKFEMNDIVKVRHCGKKLFSVYNLQRHNGFNFYNLKTCKENEFINIPVNEGDLIFVMNGRSKKINDTLNGK